MYKQSKRAGLK